MKPRHLFLVLAAGLLLQGLLPAQTSGVPEFISYQGLVLDSAGALVGTGAPVNRKVIFRVWDHPSNVLEANLIYSEEQTVTIADGKFSVLVGQGVGTTGGQFTFSETNYGPDANPSVSIANAFNGSGRYLGVTVDDGTGAVDNEIAPRQQVVSSAFAFRAKYAETLGSGAAGGNSLTQITGGSLAISGANTSTTTVNPQFLVTADDVTERLRIGVNSTGNGTSFLQSWKEGTGPGTGATNLLLNPNGGNVGIGTTTPQGALDVEGYVRIQTGASNKGLLCFGNRGGSPEYYDHGIYRGGLGNLGPGNYLNLGSYAGIAFNTSAAALGAQPTRMFIDGGSGNVTIGTTAPLYPAKLFVHNANAPTDSMIFYAPGAGPVASHIHNGPKGDVYWRSANSTGKVILQDSGGFVGIGTSSPYTKLHVEGSANMYNYLKQTLDGLGASAYRLDGYYTLPYGLYVAARTLAPAYDVLSDERIKVIKEVSDGVKDLEILSQIKITDYTHKDTELYSTRPEKKVIAQQVEKVFPQAVNQSTNVVPDIYSAATVNDAWLELKTDLKPGERVKLIDEKGAAVYQVLEVKEGKFRADYVPVGDKVFVYGREVNDFRSVDYDAIAMLNVSATQEMAKRVEAVTKENADLRARLAASELRLAEEEAAGNVRDSKLAAMEKRLSALSVSLKPATD